MNTTEDEALLSQFEVALESDPENPSHHYNIGLFLWEKGAEFKERAVEHFVISAKLNPSNGTTFRFLGHYYSRVSIDSQRASKCYQRAITLNPDDFEAGEALCDLLDDGRKESLEVAVCREASDKSPRAFWAFRRLGFLLVHQKKWSEAVQSLQHAIRGYPTSADLWEALGLAYQRLGMFTASIKSYGRAIELEGSRVFALIESGNILLMLGSFRRGIEQFRLALEIAPHNVAAHYGLASGLLGLSKECVNYGAFGWGASLLEEASDIAKISTDLAGNISSTWKLHGDIQIAYAKCLPWEDEAQGLDVVEEVFRTSIHSWKRKCLLAAVSANRSYQRALHLTPWQANIYTDIAFSLDLICSLEERNTPDPDAWQLTEKMSLGGLILESDNIGFWVILGCLSNQTALKQHALIRGLQLDVSHAAAWAYLGKIYRSEDEQKLARQAFDRARSIDPLLALPWAGMPTDTHDGGFAPDEAYESCLRAVQMLPLAEFQLGLGKLAASSGNLLSPQVFGAVRQAVERAPHYPESHNLNGLVCEARSDYQSAIAAYRKARFAISSFASTEPKSRITDISINLARALCRAGHALDAVQECEDLKKEDLLDYKGLQIYAVALWQLGKNDLALSVAKNIVANISTMIQSSVAASLGLICKLMYCISGHESAEAFILNLPRVLLQSSKVSFTVSVINALDQSRRLQSILPSSLHSYTCYEEVTRLHSLIAIGKLIPQGSKQSLDIQSGVDYLRKALHMFPDSTLIRNQLSSLLLSSKEWNSSHIALRCVVMDPPGCPVMESSKPAYEVLGSAAVACDASCDTLLKFSFPTCKDHYMHGARATHQMQKWLRQEPWNCKARYFLALTFLQKAREEKFPQHLCITLKRLVLAALSNEVYSKTDHSYQYQMFQLLLCASEISLQCGDYFGCLNHATKALRISLPGGDPLSGHLQLCRAYAAQGDLQNLQEEYMKCLELETDFQIGWVSLKYLESRYKLQSHIKNIDSNFVTCLKGNASSLNMWMALFDLVCGQSFIWDQDFLHAEQALARSCSTGYADSCLFLIHGSISMELARQHSGSQYLHHAVRSFTKAQESSIVPLPIVSALLAQAEASLGARTKWEKNLRLEWFSWPPEMRPAELYFQMHLLARQSKAGSDQFSVELTHNPQRWILQAVHLNPSCLRYWKVLQKAKE